MTSSYSEDMFPPVECSKKQRFTVEFTDELVGQLEQVAEDSDRSIAGQIRFFVKQGIKNLTNVDKGLSYPCDVKWRESSSDTTDKVVIHSLPPVEVLPPVQENPGGEADAGAVLAKGVGKKSRTRESYPQEFDDFWRVYQSAPKKANGQSKSKAFKSWKAIIARDWTAAELLEAANLAIQLQQCLISRDEFCSPLPDCFRWLDNNHWETLLEKHQQQPKAVVIDENDPLAKCKADPEWVMLTAEYQKAYDAGHFDECREIYAKRETRKKQIDGEPAQALPSAVPGLPDFGVNF